MRVGFNLLNFTFEKQLSESFWHAVHTDTKKSVAVKVISKKDHDIGNYYRTAQLYKRLSHSYIAQMLDYVEDDDNLYMIFEYVNGGYLQGRIQRLRPYDRSKIFSQIVCAINYLHNDIKVAHCAINTSNILIDANSNVKIIHFFEFNEINDEEPCFTNSSNFTPYLSPEIVAGKMYNESADIWSLGVIVYLMETGNYPYSDPDLRVFRQMILNMAPTFPRIMDHNTVDLIKGMLCKNPTKRSKPEALMVHPYFNSDCIVDTCPLNEEEIQDNDSILLVGCSSPEEKDILAKLQKTENRNEKIRRKSSSERSNNSNHSTNITPVKSSQFRILARRSVGAPNNPIPIKRSGTAFNLTPKRLFT